MSSGTGGTLTRLISSYGAGPAGNPAYGPIVNFRSIEVAVLLAKTCACRLGLVGYIRLLRGTWGCPADGISIDSTSRDSQLPLSGCAGSHQQELVPATRHAHLAPGWWPPAPLGPGWGPLTRRDGVPWAEMGSSLGSRPQSQRIALDLPMLPSRLPDAPQTRHTVNAGWNPGPERLGCAWCCPASPEKYRLQRHGGGGGLNVPLSASLTFGASAPACGARQLRISHGSLR